MKQVFFAILVVLVISLFSCNSIAKDKTLEEPNSIGEKYLKVLIESDLNDPHVIADIYDLSTTAYNDMKLISYRRSMLEDGGMRFLELKVWQTHKEPNRATVRAHGIVLTGKAGRNEENVLDAELYFKLQNGKWKITKTYGVMPVNSKFTLGILAGGMKKFGKGSSTLNNSIKRLCSTIANAKMDDSRINIVLQKLRSNFGKIRDKALTSEQILQLNTIATVFVAIHIRGSKKSTLYDPNYDPKFSFEDKTEITPYEVAGSLSLLTPLFLQVVHEILPETKDNWRVLVLESRYVLPVIYGDQNNETGGFAYDLIRKHLGFRIDDASIWVKSLFEGVKRVEVHDPPW